MNGKRFIIIGPPGSGKGTLAVRVAEKLGLRHLSTGDLLRVAVANKTEIGRKAETYMNRGTLVPDEIIVAVLLADLEEHGFAGWILDGFPRTLPQAEILGRTLEEKNLGIDRVFLVKLDDETIVRRLTSRRVCPSCNAIYNLASDQFRPLVDGKCDRCGAGLVQRKDDEETTIRRRLDVYRDQTAPVIEYYRGLGALETVDGGGGADKTAAEILRVAT